LTVGIVQGARRRPEPPRLVVAGVDVSGAEVVRVVLGHGQDPTALLAAGGWTVRQVRDVISETGVRHVLTMTFVVERSAVRGPHQAASRDPEVPPHRDDDLVTAQGEVPRRYQRVAAYAVVTSARGVLMTQFSDRARRARLRA